MSTSNGPHKSNLANKLDPTVDSDLDHRAQYVPETTRTGNATNTAGTHPTTTTGTTGTTSTGGGGVLQGVKAAAAQVHGAGETLRGTFNSGVDRTFDEPGASAKSDAVANQGVREMETGNFNRETKAREGVNPSHTITPGRRV